MELFERTVNGFAPFTDFTNKSIISVLIMHLKHSKINPFQVNVPLFYPLETSENVRGQYIYDYQIKIKVWSDNKQQEKMSKWGEKIIIYIKK